MSWSFTTSFLSGSEGFRDVLGLGFRILEGGCPVRVNSDKDWKLNGLCATQMFVWDHFLKNIQRMSSLVTAIHTESENERRRRVQDCTAPRPTWHRCWGGTFCGRTEAQSPLPFNRGRFVRETESFALQTASPQVREGIPSGLRFVASHCIFRKLKLKGEPG